MGFAVKGSLTDSPGVLQTSRLLTFFHWFLVEWGIPNSKKGHLEVIHWGPSSPAVRPFQPSPLHPPCAP